nr:putative reverse transcriptase, RNA-dependent DNA polymerase [Tanacetum cinerariifolium]
MAFVSSSSSTNEVNTAYGVSTANTQVSPASTQVSTASTQDSTANLISIFEHEDKKVFLKTGKKITINTSDTARYDKSKVECFNCHKLGHFARECRQPKNQDSKNRNQDNSKITVNVEETASKAMVAINGAGFEWSYMANDEVPTNMALLDFSDSEPEFEGYAPKTSNSVSEDIFNEVKESPDAPLVKELVSDDKLEKKTVSHTVAKREFVRLKQQEKLVRKPVKPNSAVVNVVRENQGNPHLELQEKGVIDSGCSRHMTGNMSYLSEYTKYVVSSPDFKLLDESKVLLRVPRKNNMYSVDLKNVAPSGGLTCLFAKATLDESNLWHRRLGHINLKTMNKLTQDPLFSSSSKVSPGDGFKPSEEEEKNDAKDPGNEDNEVLSTEEPRVNQEKDANVNNTNNINTVSLTTNAASIKDNAVDKDIVYGCADDLNMPNLEEINYLDDDDDVVQQRINHKDFHNCQFACFLSQVEPKKRAIRTKWIYKNKKDERGIVIRNKARLVAHAYNQEDIIDYDDVFAPVVRIKEIRLFLAYASFKDFVVYQMDVKSAFLHGKIEEEVYVCQPLGFEDPKFPDRVYKVKKALYGLHQAPRAWYETLSTYLLDNGFHRGLQVTQNDDGIFIGQDKYMDEILKKFGYSTVKITSTPMETSKPLLKDENAEDVDVYLHRSMIGSLMYLISSRPDIMFAACACARFQFTLKVSHLYAVKRIFRYLKGPPKLGLWYHKDSPFDLKTYTKSDYAGKQTVVANSTTEAKYVAASNCCRQIQALMDKKEGDHLESRVRSDLQLEDDEGTECLPNATIFEQLTLMGAKTTARNEFSSTMASAIICLATNKNFNFSKYIFDNMVKNLEDETVYEEMYGSMEMAATTATGLDTEQDRDIIIKTQFTAILNEPSSIETSSGSGTRRQETMGDVTAQTRSERVSKLSNDPPLSRVNTLRSGKDRLKLSEFMELYTQLQSRVLALETTKTNQVLEIGSLKRRVKKLEKKAIKRTHKLKRLYKIGSSRRIKSSAEASLGDQEDASKQGRIIVNLDADEEVTLVDETQGRNDQDMFDTRVLDDEEVVAEKEVSTADPDTTTGEVVTTPGVEVSTVATTPTISMDDITLDKALVALKSAKPMIKETSVPKAKGIFMQEPEETTIRTTTTVSSQREELESEKSKKQKLDEQVEAEVDNDKKEAEMKIYMKIIPDDEIAIDAIHLATKPLIIFDWKIIKEGKISSYHLIRADGSSKRYSSMIQMFWHIDREDLETLWKLVKAKYGNTRLEEGNERVLWGDLKVMFEPDIEMKCRGIYKETKLKFRSYSL